MNTYKHRFYVGIYILPILLMLGILTYLTTRLNNYQIVFYVLIGLIFTSTTYYFILYAVRILVLEEESLKVVAFQKEKMILFKDIIRIDRFDKSAQVLYRTKGKIKILNINRFLQGYDDFVRALEKEISNIGGEKHVS